MPAQLDIDHFIRSKEVVTQSRRGPTTRRRVLVVDDSSDGRWMISSILGCLGLDVTVAGSGRAGCEAALAAARSNEAFDLILMDWQMPEMDGSEATVRLRAAGYAGRIVALISPSSFGEIDQIWQRAGCDGSASKPITFELLNDVVRRHVPQAESAGGKQPRQRSLAS